MKKIYKFFKYSLFFICIYILAAFCEGVETFDLHRSYEEAIFYADKLSVGELILYRLVSRIDFIYYLIHYYACKMVISPNVVTASIVFIYYILIIYSTRKIHEVKVCNSIILITLFTVPPLYVISVARNLTAFMFLYCAVIAWYRKKELWSLFFIIIAVFTHFTTLMYVAVLLCALIIKNKKIGDLFLVIILVSSLLISMFIPTLISDLIFNVIGENDLHYNVYAQNVAKNYLFSGYINYADKLPVTMAYIFSIVLLFLNKSRRGEFWALLISTVMLSFFMNSSFSLVTRCIMFMPIFWGLNLACILKHATIKELFPLQIVRWVGIVSLALHIYGYRHIYFAG